MNQEERKQELQLLVDEHGSIDRAARAVGVIREAFREECRALGVQSRALVPEVAKAGNDAIGRVLHRCCIDAERSVERLLQMA